MKISKGVKFRTLRMNRKGLKPRKLRHMCKAEDSNENSTEDDEDDNSEFGNDLMSGDEGAPPGEEEELAVKEAL